MKLKKSVLIVDNSPEMEKLIKESLLIEFENSNVSPSVLRAKDGPEAAVKSENQKFDIVLIDADVPRLMDGGFVYGINTYKNTQDAELIIVTGGEPAALPEALRHCRTFKKPITASELIEAMVKVFNADGAGGTKSTVDVRVINAVLKSTTNVLQQFGVSSIKMEKPVLKSPLEPLLGEVSSVVDIKSTHFQGFLCISFDKTSYLEVVSSMLMEEQTELNAENQDAVGEINNIIFGNAKGEISNFGVQMTVPRVLIGVNQIVPSPKGSAGMLIPFSTSKGNFSILVCAFPSGKV